MTVKRMVKRLRNCSALNLLFLKLDTQVEEKILDPFRERLLDGPFTLLTLVTRGECAR